MSMKIPLYYIVLLIKLLGARRRMRQTAVSTLYQHVETAVQTRQAEPGIRAACKLLSLFT
jgi:hypothetical protein